MPLLITSVIFLCVVPSLAAALSVRLYSVMVSESHLNRLLFGSFPPGWLQHHVLRSKWGYIRLPSEWWVDTSSVFLYFFLCMCILVWINACDFIHTVVNVSVSDYEIWGCWASVCLLSGLFDSCRHLLHKLYNTSGLVSHWRPVMLQHILTGPIIGLSLVLKSGDKAVKVLPQKQFILRNPARHRLIIPLQNATWDALTFNSERRFNSSVILSHTIIWFP